MALNSYKYFLLSLCIRKFRIIRQPDQIDGSDRAVSLFGDDDFRDSLILGILIIVIISIDKHNDVGILLDRSLLTQVGKHRTVVGTLLNSPGKLGQCNNRHIQLSRECF